MIGKQRQNPILDSQTYEVVFPDGDIAKYSANMIALNMYSQSNASGNQFLMKSDSTAVKWENMHVKHGNNKHFRHTTRGWSLCVEWRHGTTTWEHLADLKESYPIEVAKHVVTAGIVDEPALGSSGIEET